MKVTRQPEARATTVGRHLPVIQLEEWKAMLGYLIGLGWLLRRI
ncbi:MAG: hypothetical protein U0R19_11830 [Bryobacteraceae bacterium]